eukprot:124872-Ditylum_brightwellii.AAC.1
MSGTIYNTEWMLLFSSAHEEHMNMDKSTISESIIMANVPDLINRANSSSSSSSSDGASIAAGLKKPPVHHVDKPKDSLKTKEKEMQHGPKKNNPTTDPVLAVILLQNQ